MLLTEKDARMICEKLLSYVKADDASVGVNSENYGHMRFASNAFTTSGARENVSVGVTVWINNKRGAASTNEIDDESLKATVALAEQLARISPVDREYVPTLGKQTYKPVNAYAEATSNISVTSRAKTLNDVIAACEKAKVVGAGFHHQGARGQAAADQHPVRFGVENHHLFFPHAVKSRARRMPLALQGVTGPQAADAGREGGGGEPRSRGFDAALQGRC